MLRNIHYKSIYVMFGLLTIIYLVLGQRQRKGSSEGGKLIGPAKMWNLEYCSNLYLPYDRFDRGFKRVLLLVKCYFTFSMIRGKRNCFVGATIRKKLKAFPSDTHLIIKCQNGYRQQPIKKIHRFEKTLKELKAFSRLTLTSMPNLDGKIVRNEFSVVQA